MMLKKMIGIGMFSLLVCAQSLYADKLEAGKWSQAWDSSKKTFEKTTGKKKPADKIFGAFRSGSSISSTLSDLDKVHNKTKLAKEVTPALIADYEKALNKYTAQKKKYIKLLESAEDEEKGEDKAWNKAIDVLVKDMKSYEALAKGQLVIFSAALKDGGKLSAKVFQEKKVLLTLLAGTIKKAEGFAAKFKSNPKKYKDNFSSELKTVCRDMTQNLANINKQIKADVQYEGPLFVEKYMAVLVPIGNDQEVLDKSASDDEKSKQLEKVMKTVEGLDDWTERNLAAL